MSSPWAWSHVRCALIHLFLLNLFQEAYALSTPSIAAVVETGRSTVYRHRVEADIGGQVVYSGVGLVEASRYNADTLLLLTTKDVSEQGKPLVSGSGLGRAVVIKSLAGRVSSLLHHAEEDDISLNYKRALASLLTPAQHSASLAYHTQSDVLGTCEVHYKHGASTTTTWRDLTRCSHFSSESAVGAHSLPLLHLGLDVLGSESQCEYRWRGPTEAGILEGAACVEILKVSPRYSDEGGVLNITISSTLTHTATTTFNPASYDYLQEATDVTDLTYHSVLPEDEDADSNASGLLKEMCSSGGDGRLTSVLLQKLSYFAHAVARSTSSSLPYLTATCPLSIRRLVSITVAIVGGPRALPFIVEQLADLSRIPEGPIKYGEEFLFTLALKNLVSSNHHSIKSLPLDYFGRRENQMVYEELVDYLLAQEPPAVAGVATLLEGLKEGAPQLFERLLEKSSSYLSPAEACENGEHAEAIRRMRVTSGLSSRPFGYVASLRPCFATDDVGVAVAAMDTLKAVDCDIQGVTELQKLGLESPSDPEIRIAAYRGLVHCLPEQPHLLQTVVDALDATHDAFSTQVASYVWSHVQSVLSSDDPSQVALKDLLEGADGISKARDPVWYDPRQHSRHLSRTIDVDARTSLTLSGDLIWGRYSPAPRSLYLKVALHHDGETHDLAKVMVRVTGLEAMLLSLPGMDNLIRLASGVAAELWSKISSLAEHAFRTKREITHIQIAEFIEHVMSRIPADYRSGLSSAEVSLNLLGNHAFHVRLSNLHNSSFSDSFSNILQEPIHAAVLGLMPLLDNTFSMATLSGVPVNLGVSGVGGINAALMRMTGGMGGMLKIMASGGIALKTQINIGRSRGQGQIWGQRESQGHQAALASNYLWSLDLPFSASYEYKGEDTRITIRTAEDWNGKFWQHRRETAVAGEGAEMRVRKECLGVGEPIEVCIDTLTFKDFDGEDRHERVLVEGERFMEEGRTTFDGRSTEGGGGGGGRVGGRSLPGIPSGWLTPHARSVGLQMTSPGDSVIVTISSPNTSGAIVKRTVVEVGAEKYDSNFVFQLVPTPTFTLAINSPSHAYLLKGYAGSRESITQMAGLEVSFDHLKYGLRAQLSTPVLEKQRVWSPSVYVTTPEGGEEEILRAFLSFKDTREVKITEMTFQTTGKLVEYLKFAVAVDTSWTFGQSDGLIREIEIKKLILDYPGKFSANSSGKILLGHNPDGEASLKIGWGNGDGLLAVKTFVGPVIKFLGAPQDSREGGGGGEKSGTEGGGGSKMNIELTLKHKQLPEVIHSRFDLLLDRGRVDASLNFDLSETGGFTISHTTNGPLDYKTTAGVTYNPLDISWRVEHELLIREDEIRHLAKVSWSARPQDFASSLVHYVNHNMLSLDLSVKFMLVYPGQILEVEESLAEARGGSYKNKLEVRMDPGRSFSMDTVTIYRNEPGVFSYGLSNTFKLDTWSSPIGMVGTANCFGGGKCTLALSAQQAGDQLADIEVVHTAAAGISRSDAKIFVANMLEGSLSMDAAHKLGFYDMKWELALWPVTSFVTGRAEVDMSSADVAVVEMTFHELFDSGDVGSITHSYNATLNINPEIRTLYSRQEVRMMGEGYEHLWVAVLQGRAGHHLLNTRHFGKATFVTPSGMYYIASGDMNSLVNGLDSIMAAISLSAGAGPQMSYLLSWDLHLSRPNVTTSSGLLELNALEKDEEDEEEEDEEETDILLLNGLETLQEEPLEFGGSSTSRKPSLILETLLRSNSPATGEVKLRIKARKTDFPRVIPEENLGRGEEAGGYGGGSEKFDADIRLISENEPELGRIHGSLTRSSGEYSLNGRMWSGQRSFGVISYGMSRNDSVKTSHSAVIVDPTTSWRRLEVVANSDHLGMFPFNFQTSGDTKIKFGFEEMGSIRVLAQWTPLDSAIDLGFRTYFDVLPAGNLFAKLSPEAVQGAVGWRDMKFISRFQYLDFGKSMQLALTYDNPGSAFSDLDAIVSFIISPPPYPPVTLGIVGRVSVNNVHHYVLNIDCRSEQEEYMVTGALVSPGNSGSLRLQMRKGGDTYGAVGALVLDGFSGQVSGSLTHLDSGEDFQLNVHSSLFKEAKGYSFRITRKLDNSQNAEVLIHFAQAGETPEWIYTYKVLLETERDIKARLRRLRIEDHLTYKELKEILHNYNFLILVVNNKYDEMEIEIEFPDIWSEVKVTATVVKGKDTQVDLVFITPSIKHLLEGRLLFGSDSWWSSHSGSFTYTQQGKKGRGQPFKLEVEGFKWTSDRKKFKLSMQKMVQELPGEEYSIKVDETSYSINDAGILFTHFDASLDVSRDPGSTEYKISWETDETKNVAKVVLEEDQSGGKGLIKYMRNIKGRPKSEVEYEVKANYRRFDTEITMSATLDHTSISRARAISFLHSEAEGYTELVLDLFKDEGDQVIIVITYLPENFRFRIGQFGNTFLQVGYHKSMDDEDVLHTVQLESSGRTLELWVANSPDGIRTCRKGGFTLQTPSLAPTYNALTFCPAPAPELTIQVLGVEEHEGPYLRMGQISGPGGVGVQIGSGRLQPLDTPPALTLTADVEKQVLEVLFDWQSPSIAQLREEFMSRGTSLITAMEGLSGVEVQVEGSLGLWDILQDTEALLSDAGELLLSAVNHVLGHILNEDTELQLGELVKISVPKVLDYLREALKRPIESMEQWADEMYVAVENAIEVTEDLVTNTFGDLCDFVDDVAETVMEGMSDIWSLVDNNFRPPFLRLQAAVTALSFNDDQSLYALVSRVMGDIRSRGGRHQGLTGFLYTNVLTRVERWLVKTARWDELKDKGSELLQLLRQVTTFDAVMPHSTALQLRVSTPPKLGSDLKALGLKFKDEKWPKLLTESKSWIENQWARARYLLTWHVHGESVVFGWDQAITWDGRQVAPMLTDSCHHMLVLLINARTPTAITIQLRDLDSNPRKVFTMFSGTDRVTIDTDLKMTYNNQQVRRPLLEIGELTLLRSPGKAIVRSTSGLSLECENKFDTCRLEVSWENFAATAGLLGVFDFDNNTDFMTSGWEMPATDAEWAQSWRVAGMEECSSALPESDDYQTSEMECSALFDDSRSPFKSCFFSVPPSPYLETCRTGWACGSEASYLHACQRHYHTLSPNLTTCVTCNDEAHEEIGTMGLPHEIVIITDFDCLEDMQDLVTALVKDQENRNYKVMLRYIGRGTPGYGPFEDVTETVVDSATSPLDAVASAVNLDFSKKALKSIVLFDCDHPMCTISMTSPKLLELRDELLKQGIQLHIITQDPLLILHHDAFTNRAKKQLIGLDARTTYTMSHARKRQVRGKRRFREHVTTPMGNTCASLAIQTNGAVFSLHQLKIERKYHRKIYQQLLAARVREGQNADYLSCRICDCDLPCTLCRPPKPFEYKKTSRDSEEEEDDEDYDDDEEEERDKKKKKKKSQRSRGN